MLDHESSGNPILDQLFDVLEVGIHSVVVNLHELKKIEALRLIPYLLATFYDSVIELFLLLLLRFSLFNSLLLNDELRNQFLLYEIAGNRNFGISLLIVQLNNQLEAVVVLLMDNHFVELFFVFTRDHYVFYLVRVSHELESFYDLFDPMLVHCFLMYETCIAYFLTNPCQLEPGESLAHDMMSSHLLHGTSVHIMFQLLLGIRCSYPSNFSPDNWFSCSSDSIDSLHLENKELDELVHDVLIAYYEEHFALVLYRESNTVPGEEW